MPTIVEWTGCYDDSWKGVIVDDAFSHPAKFSPGLIARIYQHLADNYGIGSGSIVFDPFGGVGLGCLGAWQIGATWYGVELEPRFISLARENLAKWRTFYLTAVGHIFQGDSRELGKVLGSVLFRGGGRLAGADVCVGSPPYAGMQAHPSMGHPELHCPKGEDLLRHCTTGARPGDEKYGTTPGNLGNMKSGDVDAVVSSPPYQGSQQSTDGEFVLDSTEVNPSERKLDSRSYFPADMETAGQLAALPPGDVDAVVSSPPFVESLHDKPSASVLAGSGARLGAGARQADGYGTTPGNLGNMRSVEEELTTKSEPESFWTAAKQIIEQCHAILKPGGIAVWVCKDFVRAGKRVPFSDDWRRMCEACGFETLEWIKASLIKREEQPGLFGEPVVKERAKKSFFRRLAEAKGSPRIDHEDVLIMQKDSSCLQSLD